MVDIMRSNMLALLILEQVCAIGSVGQSQMFEIKIYEVRYFLLMITFKCGNEEKKKNFLELDMFRN